MCKTEILELDCMACGAFCRHTVVPTLGDKGEWIYTTTCSKCGKEETK